MKAVILAGGLGTRLSEETVSKPKPMVQIGGKPILWHIMKIYSNYGINDFLICCGYKGYVIKEYFANYFNHNADITFDFSNNSTIIHKKRVEPWKVTVVDTGLNTMTGGRLKRVASYLNEDEDFCFTYGDGVSDVNISELIKFHKINKKEATLTCTYPPGRYGSLEIKKNFVTSFHEKPKGDGKLINAGFFILKKKVIDRIDNDNTVWEQEPLKNLANDGQLMAYKHDGYWQPMDKLSDKKILEELWNKNKAPWKIW
ncbi:MAG: glucose-1-phosphate cytidylyltransferase [Legionellales bacterium]|nr:glucose-1-phosphate cytidylyltransferase [Legionellales bacterium]|tara:strand:+ start:1609 stop:2379 length:771 start_codon:yes stop_codon:yes gene_type:complete